ncbi:Holliday junction resolvase RuvX [candidate division WOR-3 bacterium]|nr:Holliday junction resolvase RuvX [candidate division WOR-3 bacterium]
MVRWIGLDLGGKWTGIAMTDELGIVEPWRTIKTEHLFNDLRNLIEEYTIEGVVLGLPLTTRGKIGQRARLVQKIKERIQAELNLRVELYDERFTTKEAYRIAADMGKARDKRLLDRISATLILRGFLAEN